MTVRFLIGALALAAAGSVFAQGAAPAATPPAARPAAAPAAAAPAGPIDKNKLSYAIGYEIGRDFIEKNMQVDLNTVIRAIQDGYAKRNPTVPEAEMRQTLGMMREKMIGEAKVKYEAIARENKGKSDRFLAEHQLRRGPVHAEQLAGYVKTLAQFTVQWHVDAVVVIGCQVDSREAAAGEGAFPGLVAREQRAQGVVVALGLQQPVFGEWARLAHRAIDGRDNGARVRVHRARAGAQGAREKLVETFVGRGVRLHGVAHVRAEAAHEQPDQRVLECRGA
jgi:hypothetical protein